MNIKEAIEFIKENKIGAQQISTETGIKRPTLFRILRGLGTSKQNQSKIIEYVETIQKNKTEIIRPKKGFIPYKKTKKEDLHMIDLDEFTLSNHNLSAHPFEAGEISKVWKNPNIEAAINLIINGAFKNKFLLLKGEVGTGKSNILSEVRRIISLKHSGKINLIYIRPTMVEHITETYIADAIIQGLTKRKAPSKRGDKVVQAADAINAAYKKGKLICILIDEAHRLTPNALRAIKRWWEALGSHESKIGMILIAQNLIDSKLQDLEEVAGRLIQYSLEPFVKDGQKCLDYYREYINFKLDQFCVGQRPVFETSAIEAIAEHCETLLQVNTWASHCLQKSAHLGEPITGEIVNALQL